MLAKRMIPALVALLVILTPSSFALEVGEKAPVFTAKKTGGKVLSLSDFKGKWVVLYFYPKADTPGCTKESCSLRDGYKDILKEGAVVLGVSTDKVSAQDRFKEKYALPFDLIADDDKKVCQAYGVLSAGRMWARRNTFIIDPEGTIAHIFIKVKVDEHDDEVLTRLRELKAAVN